MGVQRLFMGLPLPEAYQQRLEEVRKRWRPRLESKLTWTRPGNWHITLHFLGDTEEDRIPVLVEELGRVRFAPFTLQGGGGGFFPPPKGNRPQQPRVVWVGLEEGGAECVALASSLGIALKGLGYELDPRPFRPHLTLARVKAARRDPWEDLLAALQQEPWPECVMDRFVLWRSVLQPEGPVYSEVAVIAAG